jgi:protoporphyrinogen oxidase
MLTNNKLVVVVGAGFTGLSAAYELVRRGVPVTVLEKDGEIGGLAGNFKINGCPVEKFYHHLFTSDQYVTALAKELYCNGNLLCRPVKTAVYLDNKFFSLASPLDVLQFKPLSLSDRLRLGMLVVKAGLIKDWKQLENLTAEEWLLKLCGPAVYKTVWQPLLRGKFGQFASQISAVWFWNKLTLRGQSRSKSGSETLAYYRGGLAALAEKIADKIKAAGGTIETNVPANAIIIKNGRVEGVQTPNGIIDTHTVIATPALPVIAELLDSAPPRYVTELKQIKYLANICVVFELYHSLSDIYWLNVNDPDYPFVGVIEHTNFQPPEVYGGRHIVYLTKYLLQTDEMYNMSQTQIVESATLQLKRMFPSFTNSSVHSCYLWKAPYAQPIVERDYRQLIPASKTPIKGLYIATMAQIYPEDRGINYAIRDGRQVEKIVAEQTANFIKGD